MPPARTACMGGESQDCEDLACWPTGQQACLQPVGAMVEV